MCLRIWNLFLSFLGRIYFLAFLPLRSHFPGHIVPLFYIKYFRQDLNLNYIVELCLVGKLRFGMFARFAGQI